MCYNMVTTHSTIDNNGGRQETITGLGNTHDTNMAMSLLPTRKEREKQISKSILFKVSRMNLLVLNVNSHFLILVGVLE